jgi:hypothetical protein
MMSSFLGALAGSFRRSLSILVLLLPLVAIPSHAKTVGLTVIEIYPGPNGQAYQQLADYILDGKNEVYLCGGASIFDKSAYHKLVKVPLATGMSLERDAKGVLMLTNGTEAPACVVPGNLKLDSSGPFGASELADKSQPEGRVLPGSDPAQTQIAPLKPGVMLVFVAAPDQEYAEFLRANRAGDTQGWKDYLGKYESGAHAGAARKSLAALYVPIGNASLKAYLISKGGSQPDYGKLKESRQMADQARALVPDDAGAVELNKKVHDEVIALCVQAKEKLELYQQALKQQMAGYANLVAAERLADAAFGVEPSTREAADAESQTKQARGSFESILRDSEGQLAAQRGDDAAQKIAPLQAFAPENPKVAEDMQAISVFYVARAKKLEEATDWPGAVKELEKAAAIVPSPDTAALLSEARRQAQIAANKAAADAAMQKSQAAEAAGDIIAAYEVLDDLPPDQHALVTDRLDSLKDRYVQAAELKAKGEQKAHEPINGVSDEQGIQRAYGYLQRCYQLTNDPALQDRITILGEDLSAYYLQQGKRYAEKPDGTGVNIGWTYLSEALQYKSPTNLGAIHDEMTTVRAAHLLKSRLSVKVDFRDQTSRRDAVDFASQLTDALATGLESAGLGVKVIRPNEATAVQPNFQMVGDVLRHEMSKSQKTVPKDSFYRFGQQQVPNEAWNVADREYERANLDLASARSALEGAQARGKKKEIGEAQNVVQADEKRVEDLHEKLNAIPQTISHDEERSYTYTQIVYQLRTTVELQFRILDSSGSEVVQRISAQRATPREYSILQNVKPEDTRGIRNESTIPNDNDFFEEDEYKARDELIERAKTKVADLPGILLGSADRKAADGDNDAAAELYILYLNSTPVADTPERTKAKRFLADQFNFKDLGKEAASE